MCQRLIRFFTLVALLCLGALTATAASSFIVNTTNDSGAGSLRQAIVNANASAGADNIYFLIISGSGVRTIAPATPLPAITDPVTISGYTQPGSSVNTLSNGNNAVLRVELNGSLAGGDVLGLYLATSNCTVRGLVINSFSGASLVLAGTGGHLVEGNFIGTDAAGALSRTNSAGVYVTESAQNIIGGTTPAARNLISGNTGAGIFVEGVGASNNVVSGNFIGIDFTGTNRLGNGTVGVEISFASGNSVGGINAGSRNVISGNTQDGIKLVAAHRNQIQGNYVGLGADGTTPVPNQQYGIYLVNASVNQIGGTSPSARNLLSANYSGCVVAGGASNIIQGNYVGTDVSGLALRNNHVGIYLAGSVANWIGGDIAGAGNLISGNEANVQIYSTTSSNNVVAGNLIGTDRTGLAGLGGGTAVEIADASRNRIGGSTPASRNVISGNREGVIIYEAGAVGNVVSGNLIGVGVNGVTPVGNLAYGVFVAASSNRIGGILAGEGNVIAHNGAGWPIWRAGVVIAEETSVGNSILGNSIFANDSVGIDLGGTFSLDSDGVTLNDLGDTDTGPNNRQNFPVLASATSAGSTTVHGTLNSAANTTYRLEFFASPSADPSGYGEGQTFLGAASVTTDNNGNVSFTVPLAIAVSSGMVVTATATDSANNTSEFSQAVTVNASISIATISATSGAVGTSITISGTNFSAEFSKNFVYFGAVRAQIISASATQLLVRVPVGATYAHVSVTAEGLTAFARVPFSVTFDAVRGLDTNSFAPPTHYPLGPFEDFRHAIGDFNGDGKPDILVTHPPGNVLVFQNRSITGHLDTNSFAPPVGLFSGLLPYSLAVADFDGDGWPDFAVGNLGSNSVSIFRNAGGGPNLTTNSFAPRVDLATPSGSRSMVAGDLDGDGRVDLVVATDDPLLVLQNQGGPGALTTESFTVAASLLYSAGVGAVLLNDLDGDGKLDIVAFSSGQLRLLRNVSSPGTLSSNSFVLEATIPLAGYAPSSYGTAIVAGDLDGDGRPDLALATVGGNDRTVIVFRNQSVPGSLSSNAFASRIELQVGLQPSSVAIADLDGDGKPELAVADHGIEADDLTISTFLNISAPGTSPEDWFSPRVSFITGAGPTTIFVADFDGDGKPDLSTAAYGPTTVSLLRNTQESICNPSPSGLVAWWRAENNALDALGTNHGALVNGTSYTKGQVGRAFNLDGVNDYVSVPDGPLWDFGTNDFTIELWVKLAQIKDTMLLHQQSGVGPGGFEFRLGSGGGLVFGLNSVDAADSGSWSPQTNVWHHLAVTRSNHVFRIYANGEQIPNSGHLNTNPIANVTGIVRLGSYASGGYELAGALDEVSVYHRSLSATEIAALHFAGSAGKCPPVRVNVGVQGGGGVLRLPDQPIYFLNDTLMLTATNARYYRFLQWNDGNTNAQRMIVVGATNIFTAIFTNTVPLETLVFKEWDGSFGGTGDDRLTSLAPTSDGGYILGGYSYSGASGNKTSGSFGGSDYWVVKLDANGSKQWETNYGGLGDDSLTSLAPTSDGGYILGGSSFSGASGNKTNDSFGGSDCWVVKLDANGSKQWEASFGGTDGDYLTSLAPTSDGGYILGGSSYSGASGNKTSANFGAIDYWVVKLGANGSKQWEASFGGTDNDDLGGLAPTSDGGYILGGSSYSDASGSKTSANYGYFDYWVVKVDANGSKQWEASFGGTDYDILNSIAPTSDGGCILGGYSGTGASGNKTSGSFGGVDYWVVKLDANGSKQWETNYGGTDVDYLNTVVPMSDGGYILGGTTRSDASGNKNSGNFGIDDYWAVKVDANGSKQWETNYGGTFIDYLTSLAPARDGGCILGGYSSSGVSGNKTSGSFGGVDYWVVKLANREAPVGTPVVLVDGVYHPDNTAAATNSALITIQSSFVGGSIRYTLDGSPPAGGILYTGVFELKHPALVRAIAYAADFSSSSEADAVLVDVVAPPFIITQPSGRTVGSGAQVPLSVVAGGTAPLSYQWRRNGVALPGAMEASLLLPGIQSSQGGDYSIVITNDYGAITSAVATVVVFAPPSFLNQPVSVTVTVGGTATFSVSALGPPPLQFQWRKNGANILGATNSTLTIMNVQFDDGASYTVVVASPGGTLVSAPALLVVTVPSPPAGDNFASTNELVGANGSASGTNNFATRETGEPLHAGKPGSNSVWYSWTAPAKGIATFRTTGSTFDTLLGIYTGTNVGNLRTIVSDEDSGGFLASRASFNASNGVTYHIAIDGLNGQQGGFVLRWELIATDESVPVIVCPPASRTVLPGQDTSFNVSATGPSLTYQWRFNGSDIFNATQASYTRSNVQPAYVGLYSVRITSTASATVESAPALLEIGLDPVLQSRDKLDDVDATCPGMFSAAAGASSVAMGSVGYQILVSSSTNNLIDCSTIDCGGIPTGTRYLELQPSASGTFLLDTVGSASRTKLWVCRAGTNNLDRTRTYLTCDVNSASDGRSIVSFAAQGGRTYQVWISKLDDTNGVLQLNWKLGLPPRIASLSSNRFVMEGTATTLSVFATNVVAAGVDAANTLSAPIYAWYFNGTTLVATGPALNLNNLQASDAGQYVVVARNEVGTTSAVVRVEIFGPAEVAVVNSGGMTELFADATTAGCGGAAARYQWRLNGALLTGMTNRSLILQGTQPTQAGQYSVTVSNCFGAATYVAARVAVTVDVGFTAAIMGAQVVLQWQTTPGKHYRVEHRASPDAGSWTPLQPDLTAATASLMVVDALGSMPRFYRIVLLD